jgi:hypothetical protein
MKKAIGTALLVGMGLIAMAGTAMAEAKGKKQPDEMLGATKTQYKCERGKKITVFSTSEQQNTITLRWNNKDHTLVREATTTGAHRFEDKKAGLVWINIPAKGMLLDSKRGRQLANECKV